MINTKYRTSMCRDIIQKSTCPRGANCNFAHSEEELERYNQVKNTYYISIKMPVFILK